MLFVINIVPSAAIDTYPEGLTIYEDGSIYAVGEEAISYLEKNYGFKSNNIHQDKMFSTLAIARGISIPTKTFTLLDGSAHTASYEFNNYIYSGYNYIPTTDRIWFEMGGNKTQKIQVNLYPKGSSTVYSTGTISTPANGTAVYGCKVTREKAYYAKYVNKNSTTAKGTVTVTSS